MTEAHARLEAATAAVTESKRLRSKVNRVLEVLLKGKYLSQIVEALHKLGESGGVGGGLQWSSLCLRNDNVQEYSGTSL